MKHICKAAAVVLAALSIASCNNNKFTVEGQIAGAKDSVLYFENVGLEGINVLDSVKLNDNGDFSFSQDATTAPEFYRLRIADQIINVSIDSTETVQVKGQYPGMASNYTISGSENCEKIRELALKQIDLQAKAIALQSNTELGIAKANDSIQSMINAYKEEVKRNYIYKEPYKAYAYFALFQAIGNYLIFNPRANKEDIKAFAAVATSWDTYYPHAERGQNLHNIAIEGMKNQRIVEAQNADIQIEASKVQEAGVLDIALLDNKGNMRHLTDLKGQVVLLDFHVFALKDSPARIIQLRELYNKYHAQGLEIYQVSLDSDEHFWKQQTAALPWISVRDEDGAGSQRLTLYNIQAVPDFFVIDRGNNLVKRAAQIADLEAEIKKLL
ncbi:MAG: AhpC/TSA family protein [Prevotella sp.]|jgi:peroxiredoxin|uniref:Lipoprotein n=2 Tax=Xylanibacter ruminicola TaxID=839 RepID=D5EXD7_XYLR2|nr:TlpA disulfide reductase family protein [Xylanibacter ruminicola]MBO4895721.1 AhpC/TSA family protein [Prevotella sp.]ADE83282.1 putative lipoprotein [Xylanibacter ruminicola 23]MBQ6054683.1 AhpC/TSA family protein [Prevotella sp.]MBQ6916814.1 AhpC/TSA family protein [Prevotella sp.]MBR0187296.1 AhpC/TSA family protein [Prevotella sp.]